MSEGESPRSLGAALSVAVGLVLADASIVVLALPEIYRDFDAGERGDLGARRLQPGARGRGGAGRPRGTAAGGGASDGGGLAMFALGGLLCGVSPSLAP